MNLKTYIQQYLSTVNLIDEESLRNEHFKAVARYNTYRLFYFRPDRVEMILQKEVVDMIEGRKNTGDIEIVEYFMWIQDLFQQAAAMSKEELLHHICESFILYNVSGTFFEELEVRGSQSIPAIQREVLSEAFLAKITFYHELRSNDMEALKDGFPIEIAEFDKNEFVDYGDEEEQFSPEELDEIIARMSKNVSAIPSDIKHELQTFEDDEPDLRSQDQRLADYMLDMVRHVEDTKTRHTAHGHFPFDFKVNNIRWFIDYESLLLDEEHIEKFIDQIEKKKVPGFTFTVRCERTELGIFSDIKINSYTDLSKN